MARWRRRRRVFYKLIRSLEMAVLFFVIPFLYFLRLFNIPVLGFLWALTLVTVIYLWREPKVRFHKLFRWTPPPGALAFVLKRFLILATFVCLVVYAWTPDRFFDFPRERPGVWLAVMFFYPLFSVIPQALIYRIFFEIRYRPLFKRQGVYLIFGAIAFSYMHLIYENWVAIAATFVGGFFFLKTYMDTRSFLLSSLEHALYGCLMFSVGLGHYFYLSGR